MQPSTHVESFDLDHTKVRAPYARLAGRKRTPGGDEITKWDLRLVQPNAREIATAPLHTLEHLMAGYLRDAFAGSGHEVVDASPMGCRTGFYAVVLGSPSPDFVRDAFESTLHRIVAHEGPVPGCSPERCGNWRDHTLDGAKGWAREVLAAGIVVQDTILLAPG
jgi:S-ribosylhomocysteine lyase